MTSRRNVATQRSYVVIIARKEGGARERNVNKKILNNNFMKSHNHMTVHVMRYLSLDCARGGQRVRDRRATGA